MIRARKISLGFVIGVVLLGTVVCVSLLSQSRPDISPVTLLPESLSLPETWINGEIDSRLIDWQVAWTHVKISPDAQFYASTSAERGWTNSGKPTSMPKIFMGIYKYSSPIHAWLRYWLSRPEIADYGDWPNFPYHSEQRYPASWPYRSSYADRMHITCGMGGPESCQLWYFWAQYGQYILKAQFFGPNQGMDTILFAEIVREVDTYVGEKLKE